MGEYPDMSLGEAREARDKARKMLKAGRDPAREKRQIVAKATADAENTFEKVAREWHKLQKPQWTQKHAEDVLDSLVIGVFPDLGHIPIKEITPQMVLETLRAIEARPAIETAKRVRQRMSAVFVYTIAANIGNVDPAATVKGALAPMPVKSHQPALTDLATARKLLRDAEATQAHPVTKLALRLLALTVVRPGVLRGTPWTEFPENADPIWRVPAERMKLKKQHKQDETREFWVPLSRQALEIIEVMRALTGRGPLVFPSARHAHRPMSENAIGYLLNRAGYHGKQVPHGWRSTFSTIMNERFVEDRAIVDLMLAHAPKDKVEGAYNRAAYMPRRVELAQIWADLLMEGMPAAAELKLGPQR